MLLASLRIIAILGLLFLVMISSLGLTQDNHWVVDLFFIAAILWALKELAEWMGIQLWRKNPSPFRGGDNVRSPDDRQGP